MPSPYQRFKAVASDRPAKGDFQAQSVHGGGFGVEGALAAVGVGGVGDLDVVGLVAGHHLVARDALQDCVHDRPLRRGQVAGAPASRRRAGGTTSARPVSNFSLPSSTKTRLQTIGPGLETPVSVPPPRRKYIGGWRWDVAPR